MAGTPTFSAALSVVGFFTVSFFLAKTWNLAAIYLRPSRLHRYAHKSANGDAPWAMVTGASKGMGLAFAEELASNGFNVIVHGRNAEKMSGVLSHLQKKFPSRSFRVIIANAESLARTAEQPHASVAKPVDFEAIQQSLDDINLTVLVNNAGGAHSNPSEPTCELLKNQSGSRIARTASLNALFPVLLTHALMPNLKRNSPSLVMNISSMVEKGYPLLSIYSASKAFLMSTTNSLQLEMDMEGLGKDVEILGIRVGKVTGSAGHTDPVSLFVPSAETMAKSALARAGHRNGIISGYWGHAVQQLLTFIFVISPRSVEEKIIIQVMREQKEEYDGLKQH